MLQAVVPIASSKAATIQMMSRLRDITYLLSSCFSSISTASPSAAAGRLPSTIKPFVTCWTSVERLSCVMRLKMSANVRTPRNVPTIVARPPARLVPPITTAPIASSS